MAKRLKHRDSVSDLTIDISLEADEEIIDYVNAYPERVLQSARRAANRTAKAVRGKSNRIIAEKYTVKRSALRGTIQSAGYKGGDGYAQVLYSGKKIEAQYFQHTPNRVGIRRPEFGIGVHIKKGEPIDIREGSFLAHAPNGVLKIYTRKYYKQDYGKRVGIRRLPIVREFGPSPASMMKENKQFIPEVEEFGKDAYKKEFIYQMTEGYQYIGVRKS